MQKLEQLIGPYFPNTVIQIASNSPENFIKAIRKITDFDPRFRSFNLNCGCPSGKLKNMYGAALMAQPEYLI
jgi:tRNA-dihydrouridine synthase